MNFPGLCKLTLTEQAICQAIEGTLNAARKDGEDSVRLADGMIGQGQLAESGEIHLALLTLSMCSV